MLSRTEYLLILLIEECNEVSQRATKALRFGLEEVQASNPDEKRTNQQRLVEELADLQTVIHLLQEDELLPYVGMVAYMEAKRAKILKYLHYSIKLGIAEPGADQPRANAVKHTVK